MIKKMLEAASKMLNVEDGTIPVDRFKAQVGCAKIIIDKIVEDMQEPAITWTVNSDIPKVIKQELLEDPKLTQVEKQYEVIVKDKLLHEIKGLPLEAPILVDGKKVQYKDAIGKHFQQIKIL